MHTKNTNPASPLLPPLRRLATIALLAFALLGLLLVAGGCGSGEIGIWEPTIHEPNPDEVMRGVDDALAELDGWDQELAEWQQQHPGREPWEDDGELFEDAADGQVVTLSGGCRDASGGKTNHLTMLQVGRLARKVGIRCGPRLVTAIAIAGAESANYKNRWHRNTNCTTDIGIWQINDYYHPAYAKTNLLINATGMKRISGKGRRWTAWYARNTETFSRYREQHACNAAQRICGWKKAGNWRSRHCFCNLTNCN